jgi:hypothetical protein
MRIPAAIPLFLFFGVAPLAAAQAPQGASGADAAGRDLKAAQAKCAGKTGAAADRCITDAQTRGGKTALGTGQYGYVPADGRGSAQVTRDPHALPSHTAKPRRTLHELASTKVPSNQPTDVVKAAQQVKDAAKSGKQ